MMPCQSFEKIDLEVSWGQLDKMLRVNKLDETQSVLHRIFICRGALMARRYREIAVLHVWFQRRQEDPSCGWREKRPVRMAAQEAAGNCRRTAATAA